MVESKARWKRLIAFMLAFAMVFSSIAVSSFSTVTVQAASRNVKKVTLKVTAKDVTKKSINVYSGSKKTLKVFVSPKSSKKSVTFKSSKPSVASVTKKGVITGKKKGTAKINVTVTGKDNKKTKTYVNVKVKYVKLSLNKKNASVNAGKSITLKATSTPKKTVKWSSSNKAVATVSSKGVVKGVKAGTATITAAVGQKKATCKVTVKGGAEVAVTGVKASIESSEISVGNGTQITASVLPANATNQKLTYSSSDESVATVNDAGAVVGIGAGKATITVRSANGKTASVEVTVTYVNVTGITIDPSKLELDVNNVATLTAAVEPANASAKLVKWSSDNEAIATVDESGKVTGVAEGTATITAAATDESGITAKCQVVVKKLGEMSMTLANPYQMTSTETIPNTVLYGDNMHIVVQLRNGNQPAANENVTLRLRQLEHEDYPAGDAAELKTENYEVKRDYAVTDSEGRAEFVVGLKGIFNKKNPMTGTAEVYSLVATRTRANDNNNVNQQELIVNTATIKSGGLRVYDVKNSLAPSDEAIARNWNAQSVKKTTYGLADNSASRQDYVVNQKVSPANTDLNKVEFYVDTKIMYGQDEKEIRRDWEWLPSENVTGESGAYSVYNKVTDTTTRTEIKEIPAGIQYLTVNFKKINLSDFTAVHVELRNSVTGSTITSQKITKLSNLETTELGKELSIQLDKSNARDDQATLVVSVVTKGQVKVSETGYALARVKGVFATDGNNGIISHDLSGDHVKWEDVSDKVTYETKAISNVAAQDYLPVVLNGNNTCEYRVPAFPYSGDAFITVKENGTVVGIYAYPTENRNNKNVLANSDGVKKAILVTSKEATERRAANMTVSGNHVVVNTTETGMTALKATININGLSEDVFNSQNGKELYTSVQWAPTSQTVTPDVVLNEDFYAIEGQIVKVEAQLLDLNGNPKADRNKGINFYAEGIAEDTLNDYHMGQSVKEGVLLASNINQTDSNGKVMLQLLANNMADIKGLYAKAESNQYKVKLTIVSNKGNFDITNKADIYWVDLGLSYDHSETDNLDALENFGNREVGHVSDPAVDSDVYTEVYDNPADAAKNPESNFDTLTDWRVGYIPLARTTAVDRYFAGTGIAVEGDSIKIDYSISSNSINVKGTNANKYLTSKDNNVAVLHSDEIGKIRLTGKIVASDADLSNVVFTYRDKKNALVTKANVGTGSSNAITNTAITHQINWNGIGKYVDFVTEKGTAFAVGSVPDIFIKVRDANNKPYVSSEVAYQIVFEGNTVATNEVITAVKDNTSKIRKGCVNITNELVEATNENGGGTYFVNVISVDGNDQITNRVILNVTGDAVTPSPSPSPDPVTPSENNAGVIDEQPNADVIADENPNFAE